MIFHTPVMIKQVVENLITREDGVYVDCTLGGGGHSREIAKKTNPKSIVIGMDQDISALEHARDYLKHYHNKVTMIKSNFNSLEMVVKDLGMNQVTGILFDLGISSYQLEHISRGFSFMGGNPLDMRMDLSKTLHAGYIINHYSEEQLWDIFSRYGEERFSKTIAKKIIQERGKRPIKTTCELANLIVDIYTKHRIYKWRIHPATRVFQALRIVVNEELIAFETAIRQGIHLLENRGRIVVISYHSLEDRIAKHIFREMSTEKVLNVLTKKPIYPLEEEINENRRARSAKMRIAEKIFLRK